MARKERRHALDSGVANFAAASKVAGSCHATTNTLLPRLLRRQTAFAVFLSQL